MAVVLFNQIGHRIVLARMYVSYAVTAESCYLLYQKTEQFVTIRFKHFYDFSGMFYIQFTIFICVFRGL